MLAPDYQQSFAALLVGFALSECWRAPSAIMVCRLCRTAFHCTANHAASSPGVTLHLVWFKPISCHFGSHRWLPEDVTRLPAWLCRGCSQARAAVVGAQVRDVSPPSLGSTASAIHLCIRNFLGSCGPLGDTSPACPLLLTRRMATCRVSPRSLGDQRTGATCILPACGDGGGDGSTRAQAWHTSASEWGSRRRCCWCPAATSCPAYPSGLPKSWWSRARTKTTPTLALPPLLLMQPRLLCCILLAVRAQFCGLNCRV